MEMWRRLKKFKVIFFKKHLAAVAIALIMVIAPAIPSYAEDYSEIVNSSQSISLPSNFAQQGRFVDFIYEYYPVPSGNHPGGIIGATYDLYVMIPDITIAHLSPSHIGKAVAGYRFFQVNWSPVQSIVSSRYPIKEWSLVDYDLSCNFGQAYINKTGSYTNSSMSTYFEWSSSGEILGYPTIYLSGMLHFKLTYCSSGSSSSDTMTGSILASNYPYLTSSYPSQSSFGNIYGSSTGSMGSLISEAFNTLHNDSSAIKSSINSFSAANHADLVGLKDALINSGNSSPINNASSSAGSAISCYDEQESALLGSADTHISNLTPDLSLLSTYQQSTEFWLSAVNALPDNLGSFWLLFVFGFVLAFIFFILRLKS